MQSDEIIWQVINHVHCSYKAKMQMQNFCRNEDNAIGLYNRSSCPLANSRYATICKIDGTLYLYMKNIERSHAPKDLWERVKLSCNYGKSLELINKHLAQTRHHACKGSEKREALAIKQAFEDPENVLVSWDPNYLSPCTFAFVECDDNNSVSGSELPPHGLSGSLSPLIGSLPSLQRLYIPPFHSHECHAWINFYYTTCILVIKNNHQQFDIRPTTFWRLGIYPSFWCWTCPRMPSMVLFLTLLSI